MWGDEGRTEYRVAYFPQEVYIKPPPQGGLKFSEQEKQHLFLAIGALTLAFTLFFLDRGFSLVILVGLSFIAVCTGFLLHEIGHKVVAQRYGCWAEFRAWPMGLMLAVLSGFMGFLFAAPGAVYIQGYLSKEENGKVSAAGPLMNIGVTSVLLPIVLFVPAIMFEIRFLLGMICYLNIFIGGFNMIPIPPLDGSKIIKWNPAIWIGLLIILGFLGILLLAPGIIFG